MRTNFKEGKKLLEQFYKLPHLAQEMWFDMVAFYMDSDNNLPLRFLSGFWGGFDVEGCKSPIEQIFMFSFELAQFLNDEEFIKGMYLEPQCPIEVGKKKYYADFLLSYLDDAHSKMLVIECDGHDFHEKTKEQVAHDNTRDFDLKIAGYDVLHFSGSQIYNDPLGCAFNTIDYYKKITLVNGEEV